MANIISTGFNSGSVDGEFASLEADLRRLADLGVETVELALSSLDLVSGGHVIEERAKRLVALTKSLPLRYTVHGLVNSNFMDPETNAYQLAAAKALVELCNRIGAGIIVQHSGELRGEQIMERAGAVQRERDTLAELAEFSAPHGVRVALENIFTTESGQFRLTPSEVAAQVKAVAHPNLVATLDFGHAYLEANYRKLDYMSELEAMAPVTGHLHLSDNFGRAQGHYVPYFPQEATALGLGNLHLPLGWGDIAWDEIFSRLQFMPGTVMMMEIGARYAAEQPASLQRAKVLMALNAR